MAHMAVMKHSRLTESAENGERKEQLVESGSSWTIEAERIVAPNPIASISLSCVNNVS